MNKILCIAVILGILLCGCGQITSDTPPVSTNTEPSVNPSPVFHQEILTLPDELKAAEHLYICFQDTNSILFSFCSDNGKTEGPLNKTDSLVQYSIDGSTKTFPVFSEAYITSALLHQETAVYVDYITLSNGGVEWAIIQTDGTTKNVIDSGNAPSYERIPNVFLMDSTIYYLWETEDSFGINKVTNSVVENLFTKTDCSLVLLSVKSNGTNCCFLTETSPQDNATLIVCNSSGVLYEHKLNGKITSYAISEQYAVCGIGNEETKKFAIETINLSTGKTALLPVSNATWCLSGNGTDFVFVDYYWNPYHIDIETNEVTTFPPVCSEYYNNNPTTFCPTSNNIFFVKVQKKDGYHFYSLSIH